jgi:hypothetical protein
LLSRFFQFRVDDRFSMAFSRDEATETPRTEEYSQAGHVFDPQARVHVGRTEACLPNGTKTARSFRLASASAVKD